jgi:hypothetical protein
VFKASGVLNGDLDIDTIVKRISESVEVPPISDDQLADLAARGDATLADDFAAVNKNIDDQPTTFTVNPA